MKSVRWQSVAAGFAAALLVGGCCGLHSRGSCSGSSCGSAASEPATEAITAQTETAPAAVESIPTATAAAEVELAKKSLEAEFKPVYFAPGSTRLSAAGRAALDFNADILKENPESSVGLHGVADSSGSRALNEKLAKQRGEAARAYLLKKGILPDQIKVGAAEVGTERAAIFRVN